MPQHSVALSGVVVVAIARRGGLASASGTTTQTLTPASFTPSAPVVGDLILAILWGIGNTEWAATMSTSAGFTVLQSGTGTDGSLTKWGYSIQARVATGSEPTYSWTFNDGPNGVAYSATAVALSGAGTATVIDVWGFTNHSAPASTSIDAPSVSPVFTNSYLISFVGTRNIGTADTFTVPSGEVSLASAASTDLSVAAGGVLLSASGATGVKTFTDSATPFIDQTISVAVLDAVNDVAGGATPKPSIKSGAVNRSSCW